MKNKHLFISFLLGVMVLSACNSANTPSKNLVSNAAKPTNIIFSSTDFEGIGKAEMPSGSDWSEENGEYYNEKTDMTIFTQSQPGNFLDQMKEYTDSLIEANKRDAPKYVVTATEEGQINGMTVARVDGKFNNGTAYVTRDYIFFTPEKVVALMARVDEKNAKDLPMIIDYIASTVKK